jgi:hypothetical protein
MPTLIGTRIAFEMKLSSVTFCSSEEFEVSESSAKSEYQVSNFAHHQNPDRNEKKSKSNENNRHIRISLFFLYIKKNPFNKEGKEKGFFFDNLTFSYIIKLKKRANRNLY